MRRNHLAGFTLVELVVALAIVLIIGSIVISVFYAARKPGEIGSTADGIAQELERAKADAVSGKNAQSFGVYFSSTTYTYFMGSAYSASDPNNRIHQIFPDLTLSNTFSGSKVVFAHLTGVPGASGTVTISGSGAASKMLSVGSSGDVSVIQ